MKPRAVRIFRSASGMTGGKVWVAPLMLMLALRSGRNVLMILAMDSPVHDWMT